MADRRAGPDASKLTFTWQVVIFIVTTALTAYASQWQIRSDVRDILTQMRYSEKVGDAQMKLQDERMAAIKMSIDLQAKTVNDSIAAIQRRQELQQLQIAEMKDVITKLSVSAGGKK